MKLVSVLCAGVLLATSQLALAAAPAAAPVAVPAASHVKTVQDMLAAMQAEKMMRSIAGASRYSSDEQRKAVFAKLDKVPAAEVYQRLAAPVARLVNIQTATEMTKYYASPYGQRVLKSMYNSGPSFGDTTPTPTAAERKALKKPELVQAQKAFAQAQEGIRHEAFLLLQAISKRK